MNRLSAGLLAFLFACAAHAACEVPEIAVPAGKVIDDKQPRIAWKPVEGASQYGVRVLSRVPNGRILASHDTVVSGPAFLPPQPLAEQSAKVTVRVRAICGGETSAEAVSAFVIDTSPKCVLEGLSAAAAAGKASLKWAPVPEAKSYEVRSFALDGALLGAQEPRAPAAQVDLPAHGAVVSVRAFCAGGAGEAVFRVIASGS